MERGHFAWHQAISGTVRLALTGRRSDAPSSARQYAKRSCVATSVLRNSVPIIALPPCLASTLWVSGAVDRGKWGAWLAGRRAWDLSPHECTSRGSTPLPSSDRAGRRRVLPAYERGDSSWLRTACRPGRHYDGDRVILAPAVVWLAQAGPRKAPDDLVAGAVGGWVVLGGGQHGARLRTGQPGTFRTCGQTVRIRASTGWLPSTFRWPDRGVQQRRVDCPAAPVAASPRARDPGHSETAPGASSHAPHEGRARACMRTAMPLDVRSKSEETAEKAEEPAGTEDPQQSAVGGYGCCGGGGEHQERSGPGGNGSDTAHGRAFHGWRMSRFMYCPVLRGNQPFSPVRERRHPRPRPGWRWWGQAFRTASATPGSGNPSPRKAAAPTGSRKAQSAPPPSRRDFPGPQGPWSAAQFR